MKFLSWLFPIFMLCTSSVSLGFPQNSHNQFIFQAPFNGYHRAAVQHFMISSNKLDMSKHKQPHLVFALRHLLLGKGEAPDKTKIRLILASRSPRRKEILDTMGLLDKYQVLPSPLDETLFQQMIKIDATGIGTDPIQYTAALAREKALALATSLPTVSNEESTCHTIILGSDTIVADVDGHILEKPVDSEDAVRMLQFLQGRKHDVHTGVALVVLGGSSPTPRVVQCFTDTAKIKIAPLTTEDIEAYVESGEPMDKAGSFGIQGLGGQLIESIRGDYFTVRLFVTF